MSSSLIGMDPTMVFQFELPSNCAIGVIIDNYVVWIPNIVKYNIS